MTTPCNRSQYLRQRRNATSKQVETRALEPSTREAQLPPPASPLIEDNSELEAKAEEQQIIVAPKTMANLNIRMHSFTGEKTKAWIMWFEVFATVNE